MKKGSYIEKLPNEQYCIIQEDAHFLSMIEDTKFTLEILQVFADSKKSPCNFRVNDVGRLVDIQGKGKNRQELTAHLVWAFQAGLIIGDFATVSTLQGQRYRIGFMADLSYVGQEYYKQMTFPPMKARVIEYCKKTTPQITTQTLLLAMKKLMEWD